MVWLARLLVVTAAWGCAGRAPANPTPPSPAAAPEAPQTLAIPDEGFVTEGMPFEPRMAYITGPLTSQATLLVTSEPPHEDCTRVEAARGMDHVEVRLFYAPTGGARSFDTRPYEPPYTTGGSSAAWLVVAGVGSSLSGEASFRGSAPLEPGARASLDVALVGDSAKLSGRIEPLVCFSEKDRDGAY